MYFVVSMWFILVDITFRIIFDDCIFSKYCGFCFECDCDEERNIMICIIAVVMTVKNV